MMTFLFMGWSVPIDGKPQGQESWTALFQELGFESTRNDAR